jgi:sulfotransferase family protein
MRPLFVFSLPRGGSTLVQRVLASHPEIATVSEPWILLPLFYALREEGVRAEYWHQTAAQAIGDFCEELPGGADDYLGTVHDLAMTLYAKAAPESPAYFLDKTPHYHFVVDEVMRAFPEAKLVFLWRSPLATLASYLETFRKGRWQPYYFAADLTGGLSRLVRAWEGSRDRAHAVRYESLVSGGDEAWRDLFSYLELEFDPSVLARFQGVNLRGRYGDPTGSQAYTSLSSEPLEKWRHTMAGPVRRAWCRRYLRRLGEDRLEAMGYEPADLLRGLEATRSRRSSIAPDLLHLSISYARQAWREGALRVPETPLPIGPAFRPPPSLPARARARVRRLGRALSAPGEK